MFAVTVTAMVDDITDDEPYLGVEVKNNLPIVILFVLKVSSLTFKLETENSKVCMDCHIVV